MTDFGVDGIDEFDQIYFAIVVNIHCISHLRVGEGVRACVYA